MTNFKPQCYYDTYFNAWGWHDNQGYFHKEDFSQWTSRVFHQNANWILPAAALVASGVGMVVLNKYFKNKQLAFELDRKRDMINYQKAVGNMMNKVINTVTDAPLYKLVDDTVEMASRMEKGSFIGNEVTEPTNINLDDGIIRFIPNTSKEYKKYINES